ncbi:hypothetical protein SAMN04488700_0144 [Carnobacterium iners]|uniref:Uncharacterized protein n=1 Tax=Carnobacterium iners TaxID=1073423 RepID=A0A1X7MNR9_9LACT|nr:hypothetical protein [Carnobacterium iners]SEK78226.1 hypothetical protein SAMN04488114_11147 [Carnobacterium iners]SMH26480.1 hypothetical protein SAMN04488700_0144 [Carnobacterium iners]
MEKDELYNQVEVFLKDIMLLHDLPKKHSKLLFELWIKDQNDRKLVLNSYVKNKLANKLRISVGTLNNILTKMIEEKLIFKINNGTYQVSSLLDEINTIVSKGYVEIKIKYQIGKKKFIIDEVG